MQLRLSHTEPVIEGPNNGKVLISDCFYLYLVTLRIEVLAAPRRPSIPCAKFAHIETYRTTQFCLPLRANFLDMYSCCSDRKTSVQRVIAQTLYELDNRRTYEVFGYSVLVLAFEDRAFVQVILKDACVINLSIGSG